jgi:antibiotic biosynthesis monooxygenase (ABM) superfamily enzyme
MTVQYVVNAAVKPGRMSEVAKWTSEGSAAHARYGGVSRLFALVPSGTQTGRVIGITEFTSNEQLGKWLDAAMGGDQELTGLAMSMVAENSPFYDIQTYIAQEIPVR